MAKRSFPYLKLVHTGDAGPQIIFRPMLLVKVAGPRGLSSNVAVLLDTGADFCMFPLSLALDVGLKPAALPSSITAGVGNASNLTHYAEVSIDLGGGMSFRTRAAFSDGLETMAIGLLGQTGFFDRFHVEFRLAEGFFTLEPAEPPATH